MCVSSTWRSCARQASQRASVVTAYAIAVKTTLRKGGLYIFASCLCPMDPRSPPFLSSSNYSPSLFPLKVVADRTATGGYVVHHEWPEQPSTLLVSVRGDSDGFRTSTNTLNSNTVTFGSPSQRFWGLGRAPTTTGCSKSGARSWMVDTDRT